MNLLAFTKWTGRSHPKPEGSPVDKVGLPARAIDETAGMASPPQLIAAGRYCVLLENEPPEAIDMSTSASAWRQLEKEMTLVPAGETHLLVNLPTRQAEADDEPTRLTSTEWVDAFYVDRFAVTNAQFAEFVAASGYVDQQWWPPEILPRLIRFVDTTGCPGPRFWSKGRPAASKKDHPVVGITWYEANAYARWAGKRLPTPAEWQRAGTWASAQLGSTQETRFPWGNAFDASRVNTWFNGHEDTVAVDQYYSGCTPNGVYQLTGNVWEWVAALFEFVDQADGTRIYLPQPMAEIRGGAFDTYFPAHATLQFRTGLPLLSRQRNVGFRCAIATHQLPPQPDPELFLDTEP